MKNAILKLASNVKLKSLASKLLNKEILNPIEAWELLAPDKYQHLIDQSKFLYDGKVIKKEEIGLPEILLFCSKIEEINTVENLIEEFISSWNIFIDEILGEINENISSYKLPLPKNFYWDTHFGYNKPSGIQFPIYLIYSFLNSGVISTKYKSSFLKLSEYELKINEILSDNNVINIVKNPIIPIKEAYKLIGEDSFIESGRGNYTINIHKDINFNNMIRTLKVSVIDELVENITNLLETNKIKNAIGKYILSHNEYKYKIEATKPECEFTIANSFGEEISFSADPSAGIYIVIKDYKTEYKGNSIKEALKILDVSL